MIFRFTRSSMILLILFVFLAYLNVFLYGEKINDGLIVNPLCLIPFIATILFLGHVKSKLVGLVIRIWIFYYLCGLIFVTQSCIESDFWTLDVSNASLIYGIFLLSFLFGCLFLAERYFYQQKGRIFVAIHTTQDSGTLWSFSSALEAAAQMDNDKGAILQFSIFPSTWKSTISGDLYLSCCKPIKSRRYLISMVSGTVAALDS